MVELAVATHTSPSAWWDQEDAVLATALAVLEERAQAVERARREVSHGRA